MLKETLAFLSAADPEVGAAVEAELARQRSGIELIASENFVSEAVMAAAGTILTNKYAEGYSGKRYYGGCGCVDIAENLAVERACRLFGCGYANVQPHSGAQANTAVYVALLKPGDRVLGMSLAHGGHLTHGSPVNLSGLYYNFSSYGVDADGYLDYAELEEKARTEKPALIVAGASAYPRIIDFERIAKIAHENGALLMVDMAHIAGLVAAGLHPSPLPCADVVTTTTHKTLRGPRGGLILCNDADMAKKINKAVFPGTQGGPLMHIIAAKAVAFGEALKPEFAEYQKRIIDNAAALASALTRRGMKLISGGTDNHLMLVDVSHNNLTGKEMERRLDEVGITVNKNTIPNEKQSPFVTSGIRVGTPAVTTRGLNTEDMKILGGLIAAAACSEADFANVAPGIRGEVSSICRRYPLY